ncbi:hypothetical protein BST81_15980 [Leptolyngbya sp. 'hensonii']|nr:hypothetical protein BST81_15980 [Leptolyngbya sp. 'hensonii']
MLSSLVLHPSETRYKALLDAMPDRMFRLNREGIYLDSKGDTSDGENTEAQIIGKSVYDLLPQNVAAQALQAIGRTLDTQTLQTYEYQLANSQGLRDYEARLVVSGRDEVLAIVRDITERKQSEAALRVSEQKFAKAFRSSPGAITITTLREGRLIEVNDSFVELTGYQREEVIGRTTLDLGIWQNLDDRGKVLQLLKAEGAVSNLECEARIKSGDIRTILLSAEIIELNGEACILATTNDITERKRAEVELNLAAERDRLLAEIALRIRQSLDLDQILHTTVTEVRQFLKADRVLIGDISSVPGGKVLAESVGPGWPSTLGLAMEQDQLKQMRTMFEQGGTQMFEDVALLDEPLCQLDFARLQVKAGLAVPVVLDNQVYGLLVAHQCSGTRRWKPFEVDLLERLGTQIAIAIQQASLYQQLATFSASLERQVEERTLELQQKMQELQELNQLKDVFIHSMSHDLRTPVMGTLMVLQNLLKLEFHQAGDCPSQCSVVPVPRSILERMVQGSDRQLKMINSLLEAHSCEVRGVVLHPEPTQICTLIQATISDLKPLLDKSQVTVIGLLPDCLPIVNADPLQLQRVFENLMVNAIQHNPPGITLTLTAESTGTLIRCTVQDNGVGIKPAHQDRLFDLYTKGRQCRYSTGIGLGLYLCRQIILAHGGQIGVESQLGQGARFWVTLPQA